MARQADVEVTRMALTIAAQKAMEWAEENEKYDHFVVDCCVLCSVRLDSFADAYGMMRANAKQQCY